ncbi:MAG: mechanosensitive ion channel, partial [Acetobacteraceae bacterium]|nr:mechanosensitive ion channel [Acetobacteraceae bacterium]
SEDNLVKILLSVAVLAVLWLLRRIARAGLKLAMPGESGRAITARFWGHQLINSGSLICAALAFGSIWFEDPARLATALGLVGAGLAFALQRVITAFAGYIVVLNSGLFAIGDRINMGGVRGDVLRLGFLQTTLMEMGVAPGSDAGPSVWVKSRQFTGRIVTVSNAKIFEEPVYNYTRDFPYIWEELHLPVRYGDDRRLIENILLEAARRHALDPTVMTETAAQTLERRFDVRRLDFAPRVYCSLTSNYLQMSIRFAVEDHGTRAVKDLIVRDILDELERAGITVATDAIRIDGLERLMRP